MLRFDEPTIDTPRNRYVRAALENLVKLGIKTTLGHKCRSLALSLERLGVSKAKPVGYSGKSERFGRHDRDDQKMVTAADPAFPLELPTEFDGFFHLTTPDNKKEWLRKLFEKAVVGFYAVALDKREWRVLAGEQFDWQTSAKSSGIDEILPNMKIDIIIDERSSDKRLIIDTKFTSVTTKDWHRDETLRSGYIYQMYTYLRSQESDNATTLSSTGMLLYPTVNKELSEFVTIQGHPIWFCTVNLGEAASSIRERLVLLLELSFMGETHGYL